ncbi:hypothetical protein ACFW16_07500 [Inquilinus sp. NPDC058860]|uniref:hypothetical protein n=1 Tax=Inquilinus sp. NPDC058860 TaxID=3346652 RepID=UPI00368A5661
MTDETTNLVLEHLKRIQAEQTASRERDQEIVSRLAQIEIGLARLVRDQASNYAETVEDRHVVDKIKARLDRIERRLDLVEHPPQ